MIPWIEKPLSSMLKKKKKKKLYFLHIREGRGLATCQLPLINSRVKSENPLAREGEGERAKKLILGRCVWKERFYWGFGPFSVTESVQSHSTRFSTQLNFSNFEKGLSFFCPNQKPWSRNRKRIYQWHRLAPPLDQFSDQALLATLRLGSLPKPKQLLRRLVSPPGSLSPTASSGLPFVSLKRNIISSFKILKIFLFFWGVEGVQLKRVSAWNRCFHITRRLLRLWWIRCSPFLAAVMLGSQKVYTFQSFRLFAFLFHDNLTRLVLLVLLSSLFAVLMLFPMDSFWFLHYGCAICSLRNHFV